MCMVFGYSKLWSNRSRGSTAIRADQDHVSRASTCSSEETEAIEAMALVVMVE